MDRLTPNKLINCIWYVLQWNVLKLVLLIGSKSFNRKSLHHIGNGQNPYEHAISIIGKTLAVFDEDNLIPCFGFGDGNFLVVCCHFVSLRSCSL